MKKWKTKTAVAIMFVTLMLGTVGCGGVKMTTDQTEQPDETTENAPVKMALNAAGMAV